MANVVQLYDGRQTVVWRSSYNRIAVVKTSERMTSYGKCYNLRHSLIDSCTKQAGSLGGRVFKIDIKIHLLFSTYQLSELLPMGVSWKDMPIAIIDFLI